MKNKKKQLIGYLLMKDLPDLEKGVIFQKIDRDEAYRRRIVLTKDQDYTYSYIGNGINAVYNPNTVEFNKEWFTPVYE